MKKVNWEGSKKLIQVFGLSRTERVGANLILLKFIQQEILFIINAKCRKKSFFFLFAEYKHLCRTNLQRNEVLQTLQRSVSCRSVPDMPCPSLCAQSAAAGTPPVMCEVHFGRHTELLRTKKWLKAGT